MSESGHYEFSVDKIFVWLFIFTALEVGWGYFGDWVGMGKVPLWGGLIACAVVKAVLIAGYFMHLKFEGWVVKGLILPTPFLILVIFGYINKDISRNNLLDHPIGSMYDEPSGQVYDHMSHTNARPGAGFDEVETEGEDGEGHDPGH